MQDGGIFFPSRLSTTIHTYFFSITYQSLYLLGHYLHGKPTSNRPRHRWNRPLGKTLNCFNTGFRLPFLCIYAEWWDVGTLILLCKDGILESWNFRIFEFLNFLILEFWHFAKLEFSNFWILNFWICEFFNFWIFECLNFWIFEFLKLWIF